MIFAIKDCNGLTARNVVVNKRRTSVRLETPMWSALEDIAMREGYTINEICSEIANLKSDGASLTSAIRTYAMSYYRDIVKRAEASDRYTLRELRQIWQSASGT